MNIFETLSKYADRQEENFLTESFVYLLNEMLLRETETAKKLLVDICGDSTANWFEDFKVSISAQSSLGEGRPDIFISTSNSLAVIEVKHDSKLGKQQLEGYCKDLEKEEKENKQLVLLTRSRHSIKETELDRTKFQHVCWYEISGWLSEININNEIVDYLIYQFINFLRSKGMTMEKVKSEISEGVPAMFHFVNMIESAILEALPEIKPRINTARDNIGFYLNHNNKNTWIGLYLSESPNLYFEHQGKKEKLVKIFSLIDACFFSLSAGEQLEKMIEFISASYQAYLEFTAK